MLCRFKKSRLAPFAALAAITALLAGCSHRGAATSNQPTAPAPPPVNVQQAIQNAPPPALNLPADLPPDQRQKIIAQEQDQWQAQKVSAQRMFAAAQQSQAGKK